MVWVCLRPLVFEIRKVLPFLLLISFLRAAAHGPAVHAFVARPVSDHDRAAIRTRRGILLVKAGDAADRRRRIPGPRPLRV